MAQTQTDELYSHLTSYLPQAQRYQRIRPVEMQRSVSSTINSLMTWSIVDDGIPILFPMARRRSSEPTGKMPSYRSPGAISVMTDLQRSRKDSEVRHDSACDVDKERPKVAVIIAGPENSREGHELKADCDVTTVNINSRQHNCSLNKRSCNHRRSSIPELQSCSFFLVRVRATTNLDNNIDTSRVESALRLVAQYAQPGATVVLETAIAVGTTRRLLEPLVKKNRLKCGFSPASATSPDEPRIVAALDDLAFDSVATFYDHLSFSLIPVSTVEVAEMTALYAGENPAYIAVGSADHSADDRYYSEQEEMFSALEQISAYYSPLEQF